MVSLTTIGSDFDTFLGVYTGSAVNALKMVSTNDDRIGFASATSFNAVQDTTYFFLVDDFGGDSGNITLNLALADPDTGPPANDNFAASTQLSGAIVLAEGRTTDSTPESGEPKLSPQSMGHTVWWTWSSPEKSNVYISGRSATQNPNNYHYIPFAVFTGDDIPNLQLLEPAQIAETVGGSKGVVRFVSEPGRTYHILFDAAFEDAEKIQLFIDTTLKTSPLALKAPILLSQDKFQFSIESPYPRFVRIEGSPDLRTWSTVLSTNIQESTQITVGAESLSKFFRVLSFQ